ncbi:LysR family transcriptional regulator [Acinetobacter baumannii]|uniref:LysR family transcriptional regulator n=1 Tax=Acinetobacter baumannii TaxID=470 RepID=UPI0002CE8996|nr:LysR family transcriptional regulator [Acinetobacter baumannii]ENV29999.1 hypothetical protein F961_01553 [Acinetobacter baumannii NIPH 60]MCT9364777.1 LysR family transcriptional regulator [Acinetobacter baumannii]MCZ2939187.1 LysR substrate-binding domain-containing protein [Acinetobacter baumannii]MCZ3069850.1 LysR substrate-binding domain-containing protein [Acinetobacter baumannii]MCZ3088084.1 LysR substrate-binding domain-containing protein [Acinetobacter baumannii]
MDRLDCISTFVSVVEHGNFSSAARALDISRDLVAKRVCYLENDLKTTLLNRTTRQMNLTSCGEKFYQHCKVILSEFEWATYEISYNQQYPEGEVKLNTPMSFSNIFLQHIISDFIEKYPSIKIDLFMTDQLLDVNQHKFDLTIRLDGSAPSLANSKILNTYQRYLYATPEYFNQHGLPTSLEELKEHKFLIYYQDSRHKKLIFQKDQKEVSFNCFPVMTCNNGELLLDMCLKDHGIVFLPEFIAEPYYKEGKLQKCLEDYTSQPLHLYVTWPNRKILSKKVKLFIDFLTHQIIPIK